MSAAPRFPDDETATFQARLGACAACVEALLDAELAERADRPSRLTAAMRHAVLGGGKRLRPFLVIETARMLGGDEAGAALAGASLELLHCYSLVHDDLPSMDDDDVRRGRATVHRAFDEGTAILTGDALLTMAFELMARPQVHADATVRCELVTGLAMASGAAGMVGGQMLDLAAEGRFGDSAPTLDSVRRLQAMKTGALLEFAVRAGGLVARADAATMTRLAAYAAAIGAAFQVADDLLDHEADAQVVGKRTGKDAEMGKATIVGLLGPELARAELARLVSEANAALEAFGPAAAVLHAAAHFIADRKS